MKWEENVLGVRQSWSKEWVDMINICNITTHAWNFKIIKIFKITILTQMVPTWKILQGQMWTSVLHCTASQIIAQKSLYMQVKYYKYQDACTSVVFW